MKASELRGLFKPCSCGWLRPLIALTTLDGSDLPDNVVPICVCPQCAHIHTPTEMPIELATSLVVQLVDDMNETIALAGDGKERH